MFKWMFNSSNVMFFLIFFVLLSTIFDTCAADATVLHHSHFVIHLDILFVPNEHLLLSKKKSYLFYDLVASQLMTSSCIVDVDDAISYYVLCNMYNERKVNQEIGRGKSSPTLAFT